MKLDYKKEQLEAIEKFKGHPMWDVYETLCWHGRNKMADKMREYIQEQESK